MSQLKPSDLNTLYKPPANSHKGQNGRLLVIGGSRLFHSSIFWSADIASKIADLVHFSSPANENNNLVRQKLKQGFWNGIVVDWSNIDDYIREDDCILIGPGMPRKDGQQHGDVDTSQVTNNLIKKYPYKKWVVDGGALQVVDSNLLNSHTIITPHHKEWGKIHIKNQTSKIKNQTQNLKRFSQRHDNLTILLKGAEDIICQGEKVVQVKGGNSGMTKGGTGDVLAGLVAALYCKNDAWTAATWASLANKQAGDNLYRSVGPYFNPSDLITTIPKVLKRLVG